MGKKAALAKKPPNIHNIKKFFDRKIVKKPQQPQQAHIIDLSQLDNDDKDSTHTHAQISSQKQQSRSPSPFVNQKQLTSPARSPPYAKLAHIEVAEDDESEDQRVVYRDSPWQEDASGPQHSVHSAAASAPQSDLDLIRRRLISAVQRPHAPSTAVGVITGTPGRRHGTPSADLLSFRPEAARRGTAGTPRDSVAPAPAGRSAGSATPSRKSTSKTPSEQIRSGSAVKRKFAPCGGHLAASPGSVQQRASAAHAASGLHRGSSDEKAAGPSTRKRQASRKRRALLDILEQVEVVVQSHKEDSAEEAGLQQSLSTSFERTSQEIERASQDLATARSLGSGRQPSVPLPDMADIRSRPAAAPGPASRQETCAAARDASTQSAASAQAMCRDSGKERSAVSVQEGVAGADSAAQENRGSMRGKENDILLAGKQGVEAGQSQQPAEGRAPDQSLPDLWAGDDGEDDWDGDLAQLMESAAALRPAVQEPNLALQQPPAAGPSGRGAAAPAGPAAYAPVRAQPSLAQQVQGVALGAAAEPPVRYIVLEVHESHSEKVLRVLDERTGSELAVHLRDGWISTPVYQGDIVHVLAHVDVVQGQAHAMCDHATGLLVVQPDVLLSGTRVAGSFRCSRQAVLEERLGGDSGAKAVEGTLLHELFQIALVEECATRAGLEAAAAAILRRNGEKLLEVGLDEAKAMAVLRDAVAPMLGWLQRFRRPAPDDAAAIEVPRARGCGAGRAAIALSGVADIEESVWAPRYGLKGMIDASVALRLRRLHDGVPGGRPPAPTEDSVAPLEFKTGKPHQSHRAQVTLYQLLMEERYGEPIEAGLLWYLNQASPELVMRSPYEIAGLMQQRNVLAARLGRARSLPPVIRDERACSGCFQRQNCALLHKAVEGGNAESAGMGPTFVELTGHMSASHAAFLAQWLRLVDLEEGDVSAKRSEIWAMPGEEREVLGRCVAGLQLTAQRQRLPEDPRDRGAWLLDFRRATSAVGAATSAATSAARLEDSCFNEGDMVIIGVEGQHVAVARGVIVQLSGDSATLSTDKPLPVAFADHLRRDAGADGAPGQNRQWDGLEGTPAHPSWRLDKDEVASVFVRLRRNLMGLFSGKTARIRRLRQLIVDLEPPVTGRAADGAAAALPAPADGDLGDNLNDDQRRAVDRVVAAQDYTLILGMPGTGKTSTIVAAVKRLVARGSSVLITAYTNSAVDNVLAKLAEAGVPLLRLGRPATVHPALQGHLPGGVHFPDTSVAGLAAAAAGARVVGCTCLSVGHPLLVGKTFDVCIMDEAGQVTLPAVLGALGLARSFCLVGDHYQLPPLVQNRDAAAGGLAQSLFRHLCEAHPQALITLRSQYRMAADIMSVANALVYNGELRCGSSAVAEASLQLPHQLPPTQLPQWLQQVLDPARRVLWLDTDGVPGPETRAADNTCNATEAAVVERIVEALADSGIPLDSIGVISPYRSQVALMQRQAAARGWAGLETLTVDKCQGRDKDAVIVSLVRSNAERSAGKLLADWRRINVALTRPKVKLAVIGSPATVASVPVLAALWRLCCERGWAVRLPQGAPQG